MNYIIIIITLSTEKKLSCLRAETCILRPPGLSVKEITRKNGKLRMLRGKMVIEKWRS